MKNSIIQITLIIFASIYGNAQSLFEHTVTEKSKHGHMTTLNHEILNNNPAAVIIVTQNFGKYNPNEVGVWYNNSKWHIFNQNKNEMLIGSKFFVCTTPKASENLFTIKSSNLNTERHMTKIGVENTNLTKNSLVFITQQFGKYNESPVGVWYDKNHWKVYNEDLSPMPKGTMFNVLILKKGTNKFGKITLKAFSHKIKKSTSHLSTIIPKIGQPDAKLFTTNNWKGAYNKNVTGVWYSKKNWTVFNQNRNQIPNNFNINIFTNAEKLTNNSVNKLYTKTVRLPMHKNEQEIKYKLEDGLAIFEDDIILGEGHDFTIEVPEDHPTPRDFSEFGTIGSEKYGVVSQALAVRQSEGIIDRRWTWKNGIIPYKIGPWFSDAEKAIIRNAILDINNATNLNIITTWDVGEKHIVFKKRNGMGPQGKSRVGRNRTFRQRVRLRSGFTTRTVIHELLHAAGMWHEHSRRDRNNYVQINFQNMDDDVKCNFDIHDTDAEIITPYDINSIMHYSGFAGSNNNLPTIVDLSGTPAPINNVLSPYDIDGINTVYPIDFYNSDMSKSPVFARTVKLEVLQVVSQDLDGPGDENEFYIKTEIGADFNWTPNNSINSTRKQVSGKQRTTNLEIMPNWIHSNLIDPMETYAKIWLQLREDDGLAGNERKDDTFNINPFNNINEVQLKIDTFNGQIYLGTIDGLFPEENYIGDLGDTLQLDGFEGEFKANIVFMVSIE